MATLLPVRFVEAATSNRLIAGRMRSGGRWGLTLLAATALLTGGVARHTAAEEASSMGVDMVPADVAFFSATLRIDEQYRVLKNSNAFKTLLELPIIKRGLEQLDEQKSTPGSPLSMAGTFLELPENQQALEVLADMVSTDTFVYGEPSCIAFAKLLIALQRANQVAGLSQATAGEEAEDDESEEGSDGIAARLFFRAVADNLDSLVVPDVVWGFRTTKPEAAMQQLKRIEVLLKLVTQGMPELADSLQRREVGEGEVVSFTLSGEQVPWDSFGFDAYSDDSDLTDRVIDKLRSLQFVVAIGMIGDRVVLSLGDSIDHLAKLSTASSAKGLSSTKFFAPMREKATVRMTGISYISEDLAVTLSPTGEDIRQLAKLAGPMVTDAGLSEDAADEAKRGLDQIADEYETMLPTPGAWMAFSFMGDEGYEGFAWNWSRNKSSDGSKPLDVLEHVGGLPIAVMAIRAKIDSKDVDKVVGWSKMLRDFLEKHLEPRLEQEERQRLDKARTMFMPLIEQLGETVRTKLLPALADGQIAMVLDNETKIERPLAELPSSSEPLPVIEPAIVLGLADAELFKETINDFFEIADRLVEVVREANPAAIPPEYRIPDPQQESLADGSVWSFPVPSAGLDEKIAPSIGLGKEVAVFSLVPGQAGRLLGAKDLETGKSIGNFGRPLASAAALDVPSLIDCIEPWIIYAIRFAAVQQREGMVDPQARLSADDEGDTEHEAIEQVKVALEACRCLKTAVAEQSFESASGATVTHWKNVIRDMPAR